MKSFVDRAKLFLQSEDGPTATEYAVMLALIIEKVSGMTYEKQIEKFFLELFGKGIIWIVNYGSLDVATFGQRHSRDLRYVESSPSPR